MRKTINASGVNAAVKRRAFTLIEPLALFIALLAVNANAQQLKLAELFNFNGSNGADPNRLTVSGNVLYGTTMLGNKSVNNDPPICDEGTGTIFKMNTDGTGFTILHNFSSDTNGYCGANADGSMPAAGLVLCSNVLYGTATRGGTYGQGTVFKINTDGTDFTTLYNFQLPINGVGPSAGLVLGSNTLYGTAGGGLYTDGIVFKVNTDGTGFTNLYNFSWDNTVPTNSSDGRFPGTAVLVLVNNTLYGTTILGGSSTDIGGGTVYKINTDGTGYAVLHSFPANGSFGNINGGLTWVNNALYGTTVTGSSNTNGGGTIFKINPDGTGFTTLFNFNGVGAGNGLILANNVLYGIDQVGVFSINPDGTGFTNIFSWPYQFQAGYQIFTYVNSLTFSGNTFYGPGMSYADPNTYGSIFSLSPSQPVINSIVNANNSVVLSCSGSADFVYWIQAATNLTPPITWQTISTNLADTNGIWQFTDSLTNGGVFGFWQTNLIYSDGGNPLDFGSGPTNVIGTNVTFSSTLMRFYRAAAPQ